MKLTFTIPVYLSREKNEWKEGDVVYDHPTPINESGTLLKTIKSLLILDHEDFDIVLIISATAKEIEDQTIQWAKKELRDVKHKFKGSIYVFSHQHIQSLYKNLPSKTPKYLLSLRGYSQVRNMTFVSGVLLESDAIIWLDDDELVKDKDFFKKIKEGLLKNINGRKIRLITGACPEGEVGNYIRVREKKPWMTFWDKIKYQNDAFDKIIGKPPRFKVSPFTHGGLSIIHKDVFEKIPCDPFVTRGEDMDFNMNAKMFGFNFFMDNTLEIRHCPPARIHPQWKRVREDAIRYIWQRNKIRQQQKIKGLKKITAEDFDPYPGAFLKNNLEEMIYKSQVMLASEYLSENNIKDAQETLNTIILIDKVNILKLNAFKEYLNTQKNWLRLMKSLKNIKGNYLTKII